MGRIRGYPRHGCFAAQRNNATTRVVARDMEPCSHPVSTERIKRLTETFQQLISPRISAGPSRRPAGLQSRAVPASVDRSYARGPLLVQLCSAMVHFIASGPAL